MTLGALLVDGTRRLTAAGVPEAARDARRLLAVAAGVAADRLTVALAGTAPEGAEARFAAMLEERVRRRPVAQIVGQRAFWGRDFVVTGDVLDPRPETEVLVARALQGPAAEQVLDLGCGSGAILISLLAEWPAARGRGVDASPAALDVARLNAECHEVIGRAEFATGDWLAGEVETYDLIVCNPPYIPAAELAALAPEVRNWEPATALSPGPSGLEAYGRIAGDLTRCLRPGGLALFEVGAGQAERVAAIFAQAGLADSALHPDLDGRDRVLALRAPE
jgi:release factor glutamine methyltransferase